MPKGSTEDKPKRRLKPKVIIREGRKDKVCKRNDTRSLGRTFGQLDDSEKFQLIQMYREGATYGEISKKLNVDMNLCKMEVSLLIKELNLVQSTNKQLNPHVKVLNLPDRNISKEITDEFIELVKSNWEIFAFNFATTRDTEYSLRGAGLHKLPKGTSASTKAFIYRVRSQYLRNIPEIKKEIQRVTKQIILEENVDRNYTVREILGQLEEEKLLRADNPGSRKNSIALIRMLGDCCGAFSTNIKVEQVDSKSALDQLIELAENEVDSSTEILPIGTYTMEDVEGDLVSEEPL